MKKALHAVLAVVLTMAMAFNSSAQMADGELVENFQWSDLEGNNYDLYEILDEGYVVVLDLFAVWCGPCWNYAVAGDLEEFYETYGPDGTNEVRVFALEADATTPEGIITSGGGNSIGDWTTVMGYPIGNDDDVADHLDLAYYPTIYTIYPNRTIYESGQASTAGHYGISSSAQVASDDSDAAIVQYSGTKETCGGDLEVKAMIQNMGLNNLMEATITVTGDLEVEVPWTGDLSTYSFEEVSLGFIPMDGDKDVTITVSTDGDNFDANDDWDQTLELMDSEDGTNHIRVQIQTDNWPTETTWELWSSSGEVIDAGGPYFTAYEYIQEDYYLSADDCYMFRIEDSYGDGFYASQYGDLEDGFVLVTSRDGGTEVSVIAEASGSDEFEVISGAGIVTQSVNVEEAELVSEFVVFPNPTSSTANVMYTLAEASDVSVIVYNTLGAVVHNKDLGTVSTGMNTLELSFEGMDAGLYFVNLTANDRVVTKKITVTK